MYRLVFYRVIVVLWCASPLLSGCSVYDHLFHPHRLGTPPLTARAKARAKASEKARHKGLTLATPDTEDGKGSETDGASAVTNAGPANDARSQADKNKAIEDMLGNTYNTKTGLLKRSKLQRMQYDNRKLHHYDLRAPKPTDATRDERRLRKHSKVSKAKDAPEPKAPKDAAAPTPEPTRPASEPQPAKTSAPEAAPVEAAAPAKAAKPEKFKKEKKEKKTPKAPKADPTQPLNGDQ